MERKTKKLIEKFSKKFEAEEKLRRLKKLVAKSSLKTKKALILG